MQISIVIPTYNRKDYLRKALESIARQTYEHSEFELIIIDDFSTDGTEAMVKEISSRTDIKIEYVKNNKKGQTMARNMGFKMARGDIIVSTDSDIEASSDWLKNGLRHFEDSQVYAVEGRVVMQGEITPFAHGLSNEEGSTYQTANMFYRKEILKKVGYLDEHLNRWWNFGSDYDLALRIREEGKIVFARDAVVYHPVFKLRAKTILKDSLKSGAIPYLYKKHGRRLPHHLKVSIYRALTGIFTLLFLASVIFLNYLCISLFLVGMVFAGIKNIHGFTSTRLTGKWAALPVYNMAAILNLLAFVSGCIRYRVMPARGLFRR